MRTLQCVATVACMPVGVGLPCGDWVPFGALAFGGEFTAVDSYGCCDLLGVVSGGDLLLRPCLEFLALGLLWDDFAHVTGVFVNVGSVSRFGILGLCLWARG